MSLKSLLISSVLVLMATAAAAQDGGIKGHVVSRNGRQALSGVKVTVEGTSLSATTDQQGNFSFPSLEKGTYKLSFEQGEFENLELHVTVDRNMRDLQNVILVPNALNEAVDDSVFAELDNDSSASDTQALPTSLASSKDIFNRIASYKFSEMRFNVRGLGSEYQDIYLNGIRFNDANTGFGPWSLWSGMNDATRNQENYSGLALSDYGVGGIGGQVNINARASQMRKGFRTSVSNGNQMYRLRAMVTYASGLLDSGWSYAFSFSTRQGGNGYVDGVYYNSYGYFASAEKRFNDSHKLSLTILGTPQERGAQQASTQEAYDLFGSNYYNPNVGMHDGKQRNARVRKSHEPIAMLNYTWDISKNTTFNAASSFRFGKNGYSALTWKEGSDPRPDYYRFLPSNYTGQIIKSNFGGFIGDNIETLAYQGTILQAIQAFQQGRVKPGVAGVFTETSDDQIFSYLQAARDAAAIWNGRIDWDGMIRSNRNSQPQAEYGNLRRANYMIEERHTDQLDWNLALNLNHQFNKNHSIKAGVNLRVNRTEYYDKIKDLLGADYWLDVDKFAERDMGSNTIAYQNDVDYYNRYGHAKAVKEGDKFSYDYYAHNRTAQAWMQYNMAIGGFHMGLAAEAGYESMWREGKMRKGLFSEGNQSYGNSEKVNNFTYKAKLNLDYRFNGAHSLTLNATAMQNAPKFNNAFASPRTRNQLTPGLSTEKILSAELIYNVNLPFLQARLSGFFTRSNGASKVISFYDDTQSSFTNFCMSGIDRQYMGAELGLNIPIAWGLSLQGAVTYAEMKYTSNPEFTQIVDNSAEVKLQDRVYWKDYKVEGTPQFAANIGLNFRGPKSWFAGVDFNWYDRMYLSMNPAYRTNAAVKSYTDIVNSESSTDEARLWALRSIDDLRQQEKLKSAWTLNANIGKTFYIRYKYVIGVNLEVKNITNNRNQITGGYEQMRLKKTRGSNGTTLGSHPSDTYYSKFDSKYFYMLGTTYFLNVYFRF